MKILALDQASIISGYSVFNDLVLNEYGTINCAQAEDAKQRIEKMELGIIHMIENQKPELIVIEDVSLQRNVDVLITLARIQGVIQGHCYANSIPLIIIKPTEWRAICGIKQGRVKREELKAKAIELVADKYGINVTDDEAEAICIGFALALTGGVYTPKPKTPKKKKKKTTKALKEEKE